MFCAYAWSHPSPSTSSSIPSPKFKLENNSPPMVNSTHITKMLLLVLIVNLTNLFFLISFSSQCSYIPYHTPLNFGRIKTYSTESNLSDFIIFSLPIIFLESFEWIEIIFFCLTLDLKFPTINLLHFCKSVKNISFGITSIALFASSYSPSSHMCCLFILSLSFCRKFKNVTPWFLFLLLLISNDIERNPGPHPGNCLSFMSWNLNSLG